MAPAESRPEKWDVDLVQQWLRSKGFSQYCVPFMLEDVDGPELAKMTKFGLMLLGISDTNLLRAIQLLFNDKPKTLPMPISDAKINLLIKDLNRTIVWLINRVGNLYELSPSKITELHRMITPSSPVRHSNEAGESPGAGDTKVSVDHKPPKISLNDFIQADTVELLERFVSGDTADDKKDITTLSQLTRAAAEAAAAKTGAQTKESIFNSVLKKRRFAEEARFDMKLKFIRRHDRIILPIALRKDDSEEDLKEDKPEKPKLPSGNTSKYLLLPTDPIRGQFDLLMMYKWMSMFSKFAHSTLDIGLDSNIYVEMSLNFIFVIDIVSNFFTAYTIEEGDKAGKLETRYSLIAKRYLGCWFWIDCVATVPIDMIVTASGGSSGGGQLNKLIRLLRGFKLMRVMKMSRIVQRIMKRIRISSAVIRLIKILVMLMFMWHCLGCFYWMIATADGSASEWGPSDELQQAPIFEQYVHAIFWAVNATMTVGTNIQPDTELQVFYTIVAIYCGLASNALVVGSIKKSIEDMDLASRTHRQDLEDVFTKLTLYECPVHLKKKIIGYFMYLQSRYLDYTSREMFVNLHPVLREDLLLDLNQKLIKQVPMFRDLSRLCTLSIIAKLHSRVYLPKEYIVIKGDKGLEMFFIVNGLVEKCSDGGAPAAVLREGDYFCENNLMTAERVASNFRALTYVETCVLDRNSFKRLLQQFPSFALTMQRHMKQNMSKKKWAKVDHVYRLTRLMHKLGGDATFSEAFTSYNQGTKAGECDFEIAKELLGSEIVAALAEPSFGPGSEVGQSQEESGRRS